MTVKELIDELYTLPQDADVEFDPAGWRGSDKFYAYGVSVVELDPAQFPERVVLS